MSIRPGRGGKGRVGERLALKLEALRKDRGIQLERYLVCATGRR